MLSYFKNFFDPSIRRIKSYEPIVKEINSYEEKFKKLSDKHLSEKTLYFKNLLKKDKTLEEILPEVYAVVREATKRTIGERADDVQLMAAIALHQGAIAEQKTGEGKTHSVIFPAYLNTLTERGVHIVTPNDYLTRVGAGWYPKALNLLGISVACIVHEQSFIFDLSFTDPNEKIDDRLAHLRPITRKEAYAADITYGTNNEFGFDYLRDHMVFSPENINQRSHYFAIVDEVDFVLIDEARTPLIISSPNNNPVDKYYKFAQIAEQLQPTDYAIDEKYKTATLTEFGIRKVEKVLGVTNLYEESFETIHYIENAIKARAVFRKDKDYIVKDNEVIIVDEFTGRLMNGRRWSDGLHQAVEAKENVKVQQESQTWATITFQNFFRQYQKLAGMTGTAATESEEFKKIYNLDVVSVPTHKVQKRVDSHDLIFKSQRAKYAAVAAKVEELHQLGQPVLIGTTSVENNQIISSLLSKKGIPHQVLNAKNHRQEAEIISKAGKVAAVTVATNMAGRGVDIILGGPKDQEDQKKWQQDHDKIIKLGGLFVIGTERHESRRIDNQLRGRSGRQGDPGASQFFVALDDELMRIFGGERISSLMTQFNMPEDAPLTHSLVSRAIEQIQVKVEGHNFDIRKHVVEYDDVINKQRQIIYSIRDNTLQNQLQKIDKNQEQLFKYLSSEISNIINSFSDLEGNIDYEKIVLEFSEILPLDENGRNNLKKMLADSKGDLSEILINLLKKAWESKSATYGEEISQNIISYAVISTLDPLWVEHLTQLDDLREGVRLRSYAQKDPLIEYRKEGFEMFQKLMRQFEYNLARKVFKLEPQLVNEQDIQPQDAKEGRGDLLDDVNETSETKAKSPQQVISKDVPGRNDPCPCGSGKKYKKCCYPKFG